MMKSKDRMIRELGQLAQEQHEAHWRIVESKNELIHGLMAALEGLLKFHEEDELGDGVPREMWAPEYRKAVEEAEEMIKVAKEG